MSGWSLQMITVDYMGRGGSKKEPTSDYVILDLPLTYCVEEKGGRFWQIINKIFSLLSC